jgi:hypothetical protein
MPRTPLAEPELRASELGAEILFRPVERPRGHISVGVELAGPCPEKMVPNKVERTVPSEVTVTVPSLCCTTEKWPEALILTVCLVSRLVAVPTNGPAPKISPLLTRNNGA